MCPGVWFCLPIWQAGGSHPQALHSKTLLSRNPALLKNSVSPSRHSISQFRIICLLDLYISAPQWGGRNGKKGKMSYFSILAFMDGIKLVQASKVLVFLKNGALWKDTSFISVSRFIVTSSRYDAVSVFSLPPGFSILNAILSLCLVRPTIGLIQWISTWATLREGWIFNSQNSPTDLLIGES